MSAAFALSIKNNNTSTIQSIVYNFIGFIVDTLWL